MPARLSEFYGRLYGQRDLITKRLFLVVALFVIIVVCLVSLSLFEAGILNSIRAYVGGEGFWSKGQKSAVYHLERYGNTFDRHEYQLFLDGLQASLGDREARLALQSDPPDLERAKEGFLNGRNHPDDIDGLINLFLYFSEITYMKKAIAIWTEGDAWIDKLKLLGQAIHDEVSSSKPDRERLRALLGDVDLVNEKVGLLEDKFSATLGDAARDIGRLLAWLMIFASLLLLTIGILLSRQIVRGIRQTQHELIASEARFRRVVESNMIGILFWDADGTISDANDHFLHIIGYSRDELRRGGMNWQAMTPSEYRSLDQQAVEQVIDSGYCKPYEKEFVHKHGHRVSVLLGAARLNDSKQSGVCFVLDISERKRAEQAQKLAATVFQSASEAIFVTDARPAIKVVNPAFVEITGFSAAEVAGRNPSILGSGQHDAAFYQTMWRQLKKRGSWTGEIINRRKNGEAYHEWLSITAVRDDGGTVREYVGVFTDITEQRKMEEQLRQSQKMEAISTLVGGIAHDFNNTLAAMKGNLYLAQQYSKDNPEVTEKLHNIDILGDHSADMVHQLMTFARKDIVQKAPLCLNELIRTHERLTSSIMPGDIELTIELCDDDLWVSGDATQLQQVLLNLLNNARDAVAGSDAPRISLTLGWLAAGEVARDKFPDLAAGPVAHIELRDNGCGMNEEQLAHIFEPFYTTKEVGKGTGLGMSMVYGSMQTHKGAIDVESTAGKGTSIHLYLPLAERIEAATRPVRKIAETGFGGATATVLLVDDNPGIRAACSESLRNIGHEVLCAADGAEAQELFRANSDRIALVITDIVMPKLGGFRLAEHIRMIDSAMPLIFMTGFDPQQADVPEALKQHSVILTKPFSIAELSRQMDALLKPGGGE